VRSNHERMHTVAGSTLGNVCKNGSFVRKRKLDREWNTLIIKRYCSDRLRFIDLGVHYNYKHISDVLHSFVFALKTFLC